MKGLIMEDKDIIKITKEVAKHMDGWKYYKEKDYNRPSIINSDGARVMFMGNGYGQHNRIELIGSFPRNCYPMYSDEKKFKTKITVSVTKKSELIARDITNRLLPEYLKIYEIIMERIATTDKIKKKAHDRMSEIAEIIGTEIGGDERQPKVHKWSTGTTGYGDFTTTNGDDYYIDLKNVPHKIAAKIARILMKGE